jgi:hypothetical protein
MICSWKPGRRDVRRQNRAVDSAGRRVTYLQNSQKHQQKRDMCLVEEFEHHLADD